MQNWSNRSCTKVYYCCCCYTLFLFSHVKCSM
jgi:hypothetical protein